MTEIVVLALVAYFGGWLGSTAEVFAPIREPILDRLAQQNKPWSHWVTYGIECSTCEGVWATIIIALVTWGRFDLVDIIAANGLHMMWQTIEGRIDQ